MKSRDNRPREAQRTNSAILRAGITALSIGSLVGVTLDSALGDEPVYPFAIFDVEGLGTFSSIPWGVNANGTVVGSSYPLGSSEFHAFIWRRSGTDDLGTLGGADSEAWDINDAGAVAGWADTTINKPHAFFYTEAGGMEDIGTFGGKSSKAWAVNEKNEVVGSANFEGDATAHAFLYHAGEKTDLGSLDNSLVSFAYDLNADSAVVGASNNAGGTQRPVLWESGEIIDLGSLGNGTHAGEARSINDLGQIVGASFDNAGRNRPFIYDQQKMSRLDTGVSTSGGFARAINNHTEAVGVVSKGATTQGFHWDAANGMRFLKDLIAPNSGVQISDATAITDDGFISAKGPDPDSCGTCARALQLVRVTPELTLSDPLPGLAGKMNEWTITGMKPGGRATLVYGFKGGGTLVPNCAVLSAAVQIKKPKVLKTVQADGTGIAKVRLFVPAQANQFGPILFQAVSLGACHDSQLALWAFQ